jgi:holo-[acyl-carrier protein] synthase
VTPGGEGWETERVIVGIGIDVVDIERFRQTLERTPGLRERLFTASERAFPPASLAARFAAKEALAKALGAPAGLHWHDCEIVKDVEGRPVFALQGTVADRAAQQRANTLHLSLSHDAGIASAMVVAES